MEQFVLHEFWGMEPSWGPFAQTDRVTRKPLSPDRYCFVHAATLMAKVTLMACLCVSRAGVCLCSQTAFLPGFLNRKPWAGSPQS